MRGIKVPQAPPRSARPPPRAGAIATYQAIETAEEFGWHKMRPTEVAAPTRRSGTARLFSLTPKVRLRPKARLLRRQRHRVRTPDIRNLAHHVAHQPPERLEIPVRPDQPFVHVKRPVDLDLHRMPPPRRTPVSLRDIGPGKGRVARHHQPRPREHLLDPVHHRAIGGSPNRSPRT